MPLRNATYAFQPDWPALKNLDIELNFLNDGLWMKTDSVALGGVTASNLRANIPDYSKEKLLIDADIKGPGKAVGPYFEDTPLNDSPGSHPSAVAVRWRCECSLTSGYPAGR